MQKQKQLVLEFYLETYAENAVKEAIKKEGLSKELELLRARVKTDNDAIKRLHDDVAELKFLLNDATGQIEKLQQRYREDVDAADWWKNGPDDQDSDE